MGVIVLYAIPQYAKEGQAHAVGLVAGLAKVVQTELGLGLTRLKEKDRRNKKAQIHREWV